MRYPLALFSLALVAACGTDHPTAHDADTGQGGDLPDADTAAPEATETADGSDVPTTPDTATDVPTDAPGAPEVPPDPATVAPSLAPGRAATIRDIARFLYDGPHPYQQDMAPGAISETRLAVLRGRVVDHLGQPLAGVRVAIKDHPELGWSASRADGLYDLAVNGGGPVIVAFTAPGFLTSQRVATPHWQRFASLVDVAMLAVDSVSTTLDLTTLTTNRVAKGSRQTDADGDRQPRLLVKPGTNARAVMASGATTELGTITVRATEYTVGALGPSAMPAPLPMNSGYTYAVEFSVDEAQALGADSVTFSTPLIQYIENFVGFPVGTHVPSAFYDRKKGAWVPTSDGRVIAVVAETNGRADLDVDGDGVADTGAALTALGIDDDERATLAGEYEPGAKLWRVAVPHFSPYDFNWPFGAPAGAIWPTFNFPLKYETDPCKKTGGSEIACQSQSVGEDVPLRGSAFGLHYESERQPGDRALATTFIPLVGSEVSADLERVDLQVDIAGQTFTQSFEPAANLSYSYTWNGRDGFGRQVDGTQVATVTLTYAYQPTYYETAAETQASFGSTSGVTVAADREASEFLASSIYEVPFTASLPAHMRSIGGWDMSVHHGFDPTSHTIYMGDGSSRRLDDLPNVIRTFAPSKTESVFDILYGLAVAPDGTVVASDAYAWQVFAFDPSGNRRTLAGTGRDPTGPGDLYDHDMVEGAPAAEAELMIPGGLAYGPDGSLYITTYSYRGSDEPWYTRIRRQAPDGRVYTFAGGLDTPADGFPPDLGDGRPATEAWLLNPSDIAVAPDGTVFIADVEAQRVRRVGTDGIITNYAGGGTGHGDIETTEPSVWIGDGGPAVDAVLNGPMAIELGPDGLLYIADSCENPAPTYAYCNRIRRVESSGIITTYAGGGSPADYLGDGGSPRDAELWGVSGLAFDKKGGLFVAESYSSSVSRIRYITAGGVSVRTVVGFNDESGNAYEGYSGDGGRATAAQLSEPRQIAVGPDDTLYIADSGNHVIRAVRLDQSLPDSEVTIPSEDASEAYVFTPDGIHRRTVDGLTGATKYSFEYDAAQRLTRVVDADGRATTIDRDGDGQATAIHAVTGEITTLSHDAKGLLGGVASPSGEQYAFTYFEGGLIDAFTDPLLHSASHLYDALGRVTRAVDVAGDALAVASTQEGGREVVTVTAGPGIVDVFTTEATDAGGVETTHTLPSGAVATTVIAADGARQTTYPDGTVLTQTFEADPRWGMAAAYLSYESLSTPSGYTASLTHQRAASLDDDSDIFSVRSIDDATTSGDDVWSDHYDGATRTHHRVTAEGRAVTLGVDPVGRPLAYTIGALAPLSWTYDASGRLAGVAIGTSTSSRTYDGHDQPLTATDMLGHVEHYGFDAGGHLTEATSPEGRVLTVAKDALAAITGVTTASGTHIQTSDPVSRVLTHTTPSGAVYRQTYEHGVVKRSTYPSGATVDWERDAGGRPIRIVADGDVTTIAYAPGNDVIASIERIQNDAAIRLDRVQDGPFLSSESWSGAVDASLSYEYDGGHALASISFAGGANGEAQVVTDYAFDGDGELAAVGPLTFARDSNGQVAHIDAEDLSIAIVRDALGQETSRELRVKGALVFGYGLTRDAALRIGARTEVGIARAADFTFDYDDDGMLVGVTRGGVAAEVYVYDGAGNALSRTRAGVTRAITYNADDQVASDGGQAYVYDADGMLTGRGDEHYAASLRGELRSYSRSGAAVSYVYDGLGRRVLRAQNGTSLQYFYGDMRSAFRVTHTLASSGELTVYFYDPAGTLVAFDRGTERYYVATDPVGSPRAVVSAAGVVVKVLDYSAYGEVVTDSAPAFELAVGFAGGLGDSASGLVRFGVRDYDPATGRFLRPDPIRWEGGANLYAYTSGDPINFVDPLGLKSGWPYIKTSASAYEGLGAGGTVTIGVDGMSICAEAGVGEGASFGVNVSPLKISLDKSGIRAGSEVKATVWGLGAIVGGKTNDCGEKSPKWGVQAGPALSITNTDYITGTYKPSYSWKSALQAKVFVESCARFSW